MEGIVLDIQRSAIHDGPGIRTTIFLKGCPLRCAWCHNPESWNPHPQQGNSGKIYGRKMSIEDVMAVVLQDSDYYNTSGGGITISGGEPTFQFDFCKALLQEARVRNIHTCLDTCGQLPKDKLTELISLVDLFHYDWKHSSPSQHLKWTGSDGVLIKENLEMLIEQECRIVLRCPIVPGIQDRETELEQIAFWEKHPGIEAIEPLEYHTMGKSKYHDLGIDIHPDLR